MGIAFQKRRGEVTTRWKEGESVTRWHVDRWEMAQLGRVGRMVGRMRCDVNYDFQNYFSTEKGDVT
jgi:hypothetical protein